MQSCRMQQENKLPTRDVMEMFKKIMFVWTYETKYTFQTYLLFFTATKIRENVELIKNATDKTLASLCGRYDRVLLMTAGPLTYILVILHQ